MAQALAMGRRSMGRVCPRPAVGCVLVKGGRVIARGCTDETAHAEAHALRAAGAEAQGATAYVTLEPCAHHGRTPPCAEALVAAGVARVVTALEDPDPRVSGQGHAILRKAGISVTTGVGAAQAALDHGGFLKQVTQGLPWVTLKLAMSVDGRIATATGESQWITGPKARRHVHGQRACHDAVLVGSGTARADDPQLTVRGMGDVPQPVRIVASRNLDLPLTGKLAQTASQVPLWLCHSERAPQDLQATWQGLGAELVPCGAAQGRIDPEVMLRALARKGLTRVYCEGGGQLAASMLGAGVVDELHVYTAGLALGAEGRPGIGPLGVDRLAHAPRFELAQVRALDGDVLQVWRRP